MTDEDLSYGTNLNSREGYNINVGLYDESRGGGDGQEVMWQPRKFTSMEKMPNSFQLKQQMYWDKMEEGGYISILLRVHTSTSSKI